MHNTKQLTKDLFWVGANDRRLFMFEGVYGVPDGVSYNSYLLLDDKVVLFDTVDKAVTEQFFENIDHVLHGREIDYLVVHHMEPDHSASIAELLRRYPNITIVCNFMIKKMIGQYFNLPETTKFLLVNEGNTLKTANHEFTFVFAPMVHWPEVMMSYDLVEKMLFSADAFGTFGALNGAIWADELNFFETFIDEARRYYTNIVGKYGPQVQSVLEKASGLEINLLLPLHGPVWRNQIARFVDYYDKWSKYLPEEKGVMIAYASIYGHTENVAEILSSKLRNLGIKTVMYDTSVVDSSVIVSESFKYSHLVFASPTYNMGIFIKMDEVLRDLAAHNIQNRTIALIENGSWAPASKSLMKEILGKCKNITFLNNELTVLSSLKDEQLNNLDALAQEIKESLNLPAFDSKNTKVINDEAIFKLSYGLYLVTAKDDLKDNGCIINTAQLVSDNPMIVSVTINKNNLTHDMIVKNKKLTLSILDQTAPFSIIEKYGFVSGREADKFIGEDVVRTDSGLLRLNNHINSFISADVIEIIDVGTHSLFIAKVTESKMLSNIPSMTYQYYFDFVKPKLNVPPSAKKQWVCKVCGYVYNGDEVPDDYICPLCKHGKDAFELL